MRGDWMFSWGFWLAAAVVLAVLVYLQVTYVWDGDWRCAVAECRVVKD